jgi:phospholipase C
LQQHPSAPARCCHRRTRRRTILTAAAAPRANHQYDLLDFYAALESGNLPAVSFLKAINRDDGHPGAESDPLAEQRFLVQTINLLQRSPEWESTAVFIAWDDPDGCYDHASPPLVNPCA